jgi:hypothetical protein
MDQRPSRHADSRSARHEIRWFTRARHWYLSWAKLIESSFYPISLKIQSDVILPSTPRSFKELSSLHIFGPKLYMHVSFLQWWPSLLTLKPCISAETYSILGDLGLSLPWLKNAPWSQIDRYQTVRRHISEDSRPHLPPFFTLRIINVSPASWFSFFVP